MKKLKNYFKAFTLVELIIVITILAILATIAFISFKNFTSNARDGNRISTVTQIEKGLNLVQIQTGKYPLPDGDVLTGALNLGGSELVYSSMGIIDENISRMINMSKTPLDPVSNSKYVYAVNAKQDKYQIATLLESLEANTKLPLIEQTYANENYKAKVIGNHQVNVKVPKDDKIWLTTVPSMIFNPEGGNILNSSGTYHIINGGQNIPYKINDKTITTKETGDKIIQHIRKLQDAKIITVDITDIVKASNETTRKAKIEEIFGTGNTQESKELLASIGAITGSEETINTTILTQTVESIITGGSVGSASSYTAPKTPAICGTANKTYENTANSFGTDIFCDVGTLDGENPTFPSQGNSVNWTCISPDGGANASCSATKLNPNEEIKECSGKPANSVYFGASETHDVTVSFGSPAPTPNYAETPSENSCDFSCANGFTHQSGQCNDITPPTGGSFTINNNAASTSTTSVTLNITCPTDAAGSTPIQVAYGNTASPTNWTTCTSSISHTLTTGDGNKTVYMRFRDSVENMTGDVSDVINLSTYSTLISEYVYLSNSYQSFVVPNGVTSIKVKMWGAGGGAGGWSGDQGQGGAGGYVESILNVTPGETLKIYVGQKGGQAWCAESGPDAGRGYAMGGTGRQDHGGAGGGSTEIHRNSTRIAVAGGGGGAGSNYKSGAGCSGTQRSDGIINGRTANDSGYSSHHAGAGGGGLIGGERMSTSVHNGAYGGSCLGDYVCGNGLTNIPCNLSESNGYGKGGYNNMNYSCSSSSYRATNGYIKIFK